MKIYNILDIDKPKTIWDPHSEFMRELEITKHRLETKPRKHNVMQAQEAMLADFIETEKKIRIVNNYGGNK